MPDPAPAPTPTPDPGNRWMDKTVSLPIGIVLAALTGAFGFVGSGAVGSFTRGGDLGQVELVVSKAVGDAQKETLATVDEKLTAYDKLQQQRYEEVLRRLDRIDSLLDRLDGR